MQEKKPSKFHLIQFDGVIQLKNLTFQPSISYRGGRVRYVRYHGGYVIGEDRGDRACSYGGEILLIM